MTPDNVILGIACSSGWMVALVPPILWWVTQGLAVVGLYTIISNQWHTQALTKIKLLLIENKIN